MTRTCQSLVGCNFAFLLVPQVRTVTGLRVDQSHRQPVSLPSASMDVALPRRDVDRLGDDLGSPARSIVSFAQGICCASRLPKAGRHLLFGQRFRNAAELLLVRSVPIAGGQAEASCRIAIDGLVLGLPVTGTDRGGLPTAIRTRGTLVPPSSAETPGASVATPLTNSPPWAGDPRAPCRAPLFSMDRTPDDSERVAHQTLRV